MEIPTDDRQTQRAPRQKSGSPPWTHDPDGVLATLTDAPSRGLSEDQVIERRETFGPNELARTAQRSVLLIFAIQFRSLIVLLLAVAACISFAFQDWLEGSAILVVILTNAVIGFITELRAVRSMEALRELTQVSVTVRRDGDLQRIPAGEIVPGDIVVVEGGDLVAADMRLFHASRLQANESSLTGESVPVGKKSTALPAETILAERANMLHSGTAITRGAGEAVVTSTGLDTELGQISELVSEAKHESTPLEKRLDQLGRTLVWVTLLIAALTAFAGIRADKDVYLMVETAIALAVASIPEGLPIVATMALARGMWRMARRNALINRLSAVETLGATDVICTDKTGTLTENLMTVVKFSLGDGEEISMEALPATLSSRFQRALAIASFCNNASASGVGDPLEVALLNAAKKAGSDPPELPRVREEAFDSESKMMATVHRIDQSFNYYVKGAAESVIAACSNLNDSEKQCWLDKNESMAEDGLRVLALAQKQSAEDNEPPYQNLCFQALVGMVDPPRSDIRNTVEACRKAGIRIVMITGDQPATAAYVANAVGLTDGLDKADVVGGADLSAAGDLPVPDRNRLYESPVFARVSPKQKLDLIAYHQSLNHVVAMTGDGVNDAPALKKADIGIAMGIRGTEVAKEAAAMVLKDDAFASIVTAVGQGRTIFANIRRFVLYLMSCNLSEILIVGLAAAASAPLPILPLQILFLNMVTDVFPALALGMSRGHHDQMLEPPRNADEPILRRREWWQIVGYSALISTSILGVFSLALLHYNLAVEEAVTIAFISLAGVQLVHVFNMREPAEKVFVNQITRNRFVWAAIALCVALLAAALFIPALAKTLALQTPSATGWRLIAIGVAIPLLAVQIGSAIKSRFKRFQKPHQ